MKQKTYIAIDLQALEHNISIIRLKNPKKNIQAVVKANAYGHGEVEISKHLERLGIKHFGVARVEEGVNLRKHGILADIQVLGGANTKEEILLASEYRLTLTIYSFENYKLILELINSVNLNINFVLKIETGMHRLGLTEKDLKSFYENYSSKLNITGIMSHFLDAGNLDSDWSEFQIEKFKKAISIHKKYFPDFNGDTHIENTAGFFNYNLDFTNLARIGIGIYGYGNEKLRPVITLHSFIKDIKELKKDETISYGGWYRAKKDTRVAIIPVGYGDGFLRANRKGSVTINGKKAEILGVICMDYFMLDITDIANLNIGDTLEIIGQKTDAQYWAKTSGTIVYEILTSLNPRLRRIYKN